MRVVSRLTGLSADTIRVWERRYGAVDPDRTDGNKRRYSGAHVRRLVLLRRATELGHSIGQVVQLPDQELRGLIGESSPDVGSQVSLYAAIVEDYLTAILEYQVQRAELILSRSAAILPPMTLTLEVIVPLMRRVGEAWQRKQLRIPHEHIISGHRDQHNKFAPRFRTYALHRLAGGLHRHQHSRHRQSARSGSLVLARSRRCSLPPHLHRRGVRFPWRRWLLHRVHAL